MSEGNLKQILTLGNSIIGVSILAMPYCLKQCGLVLGIILLIISGYINRINCHFLIKSAISTKRRSYEFLAFHIFGPMGKFAIEVIQIGFLFGICVSFFVIAGDLGPKILAQVLDIEYTDRFRAFFLCGLCFFIVLPLSLLRNTDSLASISAISITFYVLLVLKIVSDSWRHIVTGSWQAEVELWRPAGVLQALPIMSLALACQTNVFSIYESLPDPSLSRMNTVVAGAINLCSSVYILVGFFGYVAFHDVPFGGNILVQLLPSPVTRWINIGFVMSIALGFPLVVYPCRVSVNSLLFRRPGSSLELPQNHIPELRFKCITFCILITAMCIGIVIPSIEVVLGLLGSTMGTAIAILFPSVMFIKNTSRNNLEKMAAQMSFILGIVLLVCGTYMNLYAVDQLAQEPVPVPVPAVTAPPAVSSPAAAAVGAPALSNVTDKKDLVPDKPPGDTDGDGRQGEEKSKKAPPEEEARKEPAIPEPPPEKKPADEDAEKTAKDGDTKTDDEKKAAGKKRKTSAEETDGGDAAGGKKKPGGRKSKHRDSKKNDDGAADAAEDAEAEADAGDAAGSVGDTEKRAADGSPGVAAGGEGLDMGALRKEEEERERDNALRPEDPQAKELELKQEAVLQKLEETHKEQKELLQEQKALLKEMKQQRSEQEIEALKRANQEAAPGGVGVQQQQQPAMLQQQPAMVQQQQPGIAQQQPGLAQQQQQPGMVQQQQPGIAQQQQQPGIVQQQPGLAQQQQQPGIVQQQPGMVQQQQQPAMVQQQQPGIVQQQPGIVQQQPAMVQQQQPAMAQQQQQQQPGIVQQQSGMVQQQQQPAMVQQQQSGMVQQQQQPAMVQQQQPAMVQQQSGMVHQQQQPGMIQQQQPGMVQQQPAGQVPPALGQGQQQQFVPIQPLIQKQIQQQQQFQQQQQQQQQPAVNQAGPAINIPSLQGKQPAPIPVAAAAAAGAGAASKRERAPAQQKTADADSAQKKHNKHASHGRVRREAAGSAEDEMLVRLAENWAAMEAGDIVARATARRR